MKCPGFKCWSCGRPVSSDMEIHKTGWLHSECVRIRVACSRCGAVHTRMFSGSGLSKMSVDELVKFVKDKVSFQAFGSSMGVGDE